LNALLKDVDARILFGEAKKRPELYSKAVNYLVSNTKRLTSDLIVSALDEGRYFLLLALSEVLIRSRKLMYRVFLELLGRNPTYAKTLGLNYLTLYRMLLKGPAKPAAISRRVNIAQVEECLKYGASIAEELHVLRCRESYVSRLVGAEGSVSKALSVALPLALRPSVIRLPKRYGDSYWLTLWPYTVAYSVDEAKLRWLQYGSLVREFDVSKLIVSSSVPHFTPLGSGAALVFREPLRSVVVISSSYVEEPRVVVGRSVCYDGIDSLYSIELSDEGIHIRRYDELGHLLYDRLENASGLGDVRAVECYPVSGRGVMFNVVTKRGSLVITVSSSVNKYRFKEVVKAVAALPLGYSVVYTDREIYVARVSEEGLNVAGPYSRPHIEDPLHLGVAQDLGIFAVTSRRLYQLDALGNIVSSKNLQVSREYAQVKTINTYLLPLLVLARGGTVSEILAYLEGDLTRLDLRALGIEGEVIDVTYGNGVLCFNTADSLSLCTSPLYVSWAARGTLRRVERYRLRGLQDVYDKLRSGESLTYLGEVGTYFDSQLLEEVVHRDYWIRSALAGVTGRSTSTALGKILRKALDVSYGDEYLDLALAGYRDSIESCELTIARSTTSKVLSRSSLSEVDLNAVSAIDRAIGELSSTGTRRHVVKAVARLLGAFEGLGIDPQDLRYVLSSLPAELGGSLLRSLVLEALSSTPVVSSTAAEVLRVLGYDIGSLRSRVASIVEALSKLFPEIAEVVQKRCEALLAEARFSELTEYLSNSRRLLELVEGLSARLKGYGVSLPENQEFKDEVAKCFSTQLTSLQLSRCVDGLNSLSECYAKLRSLLEEVYSKIGSSRYISRDAINRELGGIRSCGELIKTVGRLREKAGRLLAIEESLNNLVKHLEGLQPLGEVIKDDVGRAYEAIGKLDEQRAKELLNDLRDNVRELAEVGRCLREFLHLKDREPFNYVSSHIEGIVEDLMERLRSRSIGLDQLRRLRLNIARVAEESTRIERVIKSMEEVLGLLVSSPEELVRHKAFILSQYLNIVVSQGFEVGSRELSMLQEVLSGIKAEMNSFASNVSGVGEVGRAIGFTKLPEILSNTILDIKSRYGGLTVASLPAYIERYQELLNEMRAHNERARSLYVELSNLATFIASLDRDVSTQILEYLSNLLNVYASAGGSIMLNELPTRIAEILRLRTYIYDVSKRLRDLREREVPRSRFGKALIRSAIERALECLRALKVDEAFKYLDLALEIIAKMMVYGTRIHTVDTIISMLEDDGVDIERITLSKDPIKKLDEVRKLSGIEDILAYNPKIVTGSLLATGKIDDGIRISRLAYVAARKLGTSEVVKALSTVKPGSLNDVVLQLLNSVGKSVLKVEEDGPASHVALLRIFDDYLPYAGDLTCRDREKVGELYHTLCVSGDILQTIALAALWCSEGGGNVRCYNAIGILGGFHVKVLRSYVNELSRALETKYADQDLATINYVVKAFWSSRPPRVYEELDRLTTFAREERSRVYEVLKTHSNYVRSYTVMEVLRLSREIYEILRDEDYYRRKLQKDLELRILGELSTDIGSDITLRVVNGLELPVEVKDVKLHGFIVSERVVRIEPGGYQDLKVHVPRLDVDDRVLGSGRELSIDVQLSARIPGVQADRYLAIYSHVVAPVRYYGPRSTLVSYIEMLRQQLLDVELPMRLGDAILGVGGNNVVLVGFSREDGRRVVIKVPGFIADLGGIPTISLDILNRCRSYVERCTKATSRCRGRVARVRRIELNPPYAVEDYIDGVSLRSILNERKRLSRSEAVSIALGVGEAIRCLHSSGVFHNDLRPENVMIVGGSIVLIDCCIDEIWDTLRWPLGAQVGTGSRVGSRVDEAYAHPLLLGRLREGSMSDDDRAKLDVFQLGLLVYEMLLGYNPIGRLRSGTLRLLPQGLEDLENVLVKVCSPARLPELSMEEFLEKLRKLL